MSWRGEIGLIFGLPGNSHPGGRASRQYSRSRSNKAGDSMALRSLPPLPSSTWINMRSLSISVTLRLQTSDARKPAP
jgi:hypothetical protein